MTEAAWLASRTSRKLLGFLDGKLTERKLRLIGCGCCRVCKPSFTLDECRTATDVAERIADGAASEREIAEGYRAANYARNMATGTLRSIPRRYKRRPARNAAWAVYELVVSLDADSGYLQTLLNCVSDALDYLADIAPHQSLNRLLQARVIRDIVGNPYHPVAFDPTWRTTTAVALAKGMYDARDFGAMPILADALQDAGCDEKGVLDHCRKPGPHVRGCWVVDRVLGKS